MADLANGTACFEYVDTNNELEFKLPFASISSAFSGMRKKESLFFAKIGGARGATQAR